MAQQINDFKEAMGVLERLMLFEPYVPERKANTVYLMSFKLTDKSFTYKLVINDKIFIHTELFTEGFSKGIIKSAAYYLNNTLIDIVDEITTNTEADNDGTI